jgi:hypothetical protein
MAPTKILEILRIEVSSFQWPGTAGTDGVLSKSATPCSAKALAASTISIAQSGAVMPSLCLGEFRSTDVLTGIVQVSATFLV